MLKRTRREYRGLTALLLLTLTACSALEVTPAKLAVSTSPDREQAERLWLESLELANRFLASDQRHSLPPGRLELDEEGMRFESDQGVLPMHVWVSGWGGLANRLGFQAQERENGFVVGAVEADEADPLIANSFFRRLDGGWLSAAQQADLILHETTHVYFREGTVGFWNGFAYYLEVIFLWRTSTHSAEEIPNRTSAEFARFLATSESEASVSERELAACE